MTARLLSSTAVALCSMSATAPTASASVDFPTSAIVLAQYQELDVSRGVPTVVPEASIDTGIERGDATDEKQDNSNISKAYTWALTLTDGGVVVSGDVPASAFQRYLAVKAAMSTHDKSDVREGAPDGFVEDALAALESLRMLAVGSVGLDEAGWFVEGELADGYGEAEILRALASGATPTEAWRIYVSSAEPSEAGTPATGDVVVEEKPDVDQADDPQVAADTAAGETGGKLLVTEAIPDIESEVDVGRDVDTVSEPDTKIAPESEPDSAASSEPVMPTPPAFRFSATKDEDGGIDLAGNATEDFLQVVGNSSAFNSETLVSSLDAPAGFAAAANAGLAALALLDSGQVILRDGVWLLSGNARTEYVKDAVLGILQSQAPETEWKTLILAQPALDICRDEVSAYTIDNPILFPSAGIVPTPASLTSLSGLAEIFELCPEAPIYVEGHTDADGTAEANLSLSIRRAEAVVDALVELGVEPGRLFAVGYGAGLPIASNATSEGKRQNRRIVFNFEDIARPIP